MFDPKLIERDQMEMEQARQGFENMMREAAIWFLPSHQKFDALGQMQFGRGPQNDVVIFDPHASQTLAQARAMFVSYLMPRGQIWQRWQLPDPELMKLRHVREWVDQKNRDLFSLRNDPKSGFTNQTGECASSLLALGMQSTWPSIRRDVRGRELGLSYQADFVGQVFVKTNAEGLVSTVHFAFNFTAEKASQVSELAQAEAVLKAMRDSDPSRMIRFLHVVKPNLEFDPAMIDWRGKPWAGCYFERGQQQVLKVGGYRTMPRIVSRYETAPNEDYGRAPAFSVLPAVRAGQQLILDLVLASEMNAMPPLGAHDDMMDQTVKYAAREVTYGAIDHRGNRRLVPLIEGSDMNGSFTLLEKCHQTIDRALFVDMLQIRNELKSHVTDSQLYQREEEKGILLSSLANQETEWLSPMLDREIDLMDEMGMFDDMPGEVEEAVNDGMKLLEVTYDNGVTRAQDAGQAAGYFRLIEQSAAMWQADQSGEAFKAFLRKYPQDIVLDRLARINGIPADWEAPEERQRQELEADLFRSEQQDLITALPAVSKSVKDLASAQPTGA